MTYVIKVLVLVAMLAFLTLTILLYPAELLLVWLGSRGNRKAREIHQRYGEAASAIVVWLWKKVGIE